MRILVADCSKQLTEMACKQLGCCASFDYLRSMGE